MDLHNQNYKTLRCYLNVFNKKSVNYAFVFSLFLLILVLLNIYFFYTLSSVIKPPSFNLPSSKVGVTPSVFRDIYECLNNLPAKYKTKNLKFLDIEKSLIHSFNSTSHNDAKNIWQDVANWDSDQSLFPNQNGVQGRILHAIHTAPIAFIDNAPKGTQLKLLLMLQDKQMIYFKPKRYNLNEIINGTIYAGFDRHNSEVFAYYLAMVLHFNWIAPSVIRKIHVDNELLTFSSAGLKQTMVKTGTGSYCIYGKCFYCKVNETVCPDDRGEIEGAAILYLDKQFRVQKSPWRRSYNNRKMEWEINNDFCKKVSRTLSMKRILNLIDISIFDFLIQNGDRHRYEIYKDKILLFDNGKGLGNPKVDELDILAPLYQCCMMSASTWQRLEMVSGGSLTESIRYLSSLQGQVLATKDHFKAVERRLLKIYATIQYCIGRYGSEKVFKNAI